MLQSDAGDCLRSHGNEEIGVNKRADWNIDTTIGRMASSSQDGFLTFVDGRRYGSPYKRLDELLGGRPHRPIMR